MSKTTKQKKHHQVATLEDFRDRGRLILEKTFFTRANIHSSDLYQHKTHIGMDIPSFKGLILEELVLI